MTLDTAVPPVAPEQTQATARWEDFVDIFLSPAQVFRRRASESWVVPMTVLAVMGMVLYYALLPVQSMIQEAALAQRGQVNPDAQAFMEEWGGIFKLVGGIIAPIFMAVMIAVSAAVTWAGARLLDVALSYRQSLMITAYVGMVTIIQQLAVGVSMLMRQNSGEEFNLLRDASFGVMRFIEPGTLPNFAQAVLTRVDIFPIWQLILLAIGLQVVTGASRGKAYVVAVLTSLFFVLPALLQVLGGAARG